MEKVLYQELRPREFAERIAKTPIAYLPLGTLEWHGLHLPLGSDGLQSQGLFCEMARRVGGIVLPMLFLGPDKTKEVDGIKFLSKSTQAQLINHLKRNKNFHLIFHYMPKLIPN